MEDFQTLVCGVHQQIPRRNVLMCDPGNEIEEVNCACQLFNPSETGRDGTIRV